MSEDDESDELQGADLIRAIAQIRAGVSVLLYRIVLNGPPSPRCADEYIYENDVTKSVDTKHPCPNIQILEVCTAPEVIDLTNESPSVPSPCATYSSERTPSTQYIALASKDSNEVLPVINEHREKLTLDNTARSIDKNHTTKEIVRKSKCTLDVDAQKRERALTEKRTRVRDKLKKTERSKKVKNSNNATKKLPTKPASMPMKKRTGSLRKNLSSDADTSLKKIAPKHEISQDSSALYTAWIVREISVITVAKCESESNSSDSFFSQNKPGHVESVEKAQQFINTVQSSTSSSQNVSDVQPRIISYHNKDEEFTPTAKSRANAAPMKKAGHSLPYVISKPPSVPRRSSQCTKSEATCTPVVQKSDEANLLRKSSTDLSVNQPVTALSLVSKPLQESNIEECFSSRLVPVQEKSADILPSKSQDGRQSSAKTDHVQRSDNDVPCIELKHPINQATLLSAETRTEERTNSQPSASVRKKKSMGALPINAKDANKSSPESEYLKIIEQQLSANNVLITPSGTPVKKISPTAVKLEDKPVAAEEVTLKNHAASLDTSLPAGNKSPNVPVVETENGYCQLKLPFVIATWKAPSTSETAISDAPPAESVSPVSVPSKTIRVKSFEDLKSGSTSNEKPTSWHVPTPQLECPKYGISSSTASFSLGTKDSTSAMNVPMAPQCVSEPLALTVSARSQKAEAITSSFRVPAASSRISVVTSDSSLTPLKTSTAPQSVMESRTSSLPGQSNGTPSSERHTDHMIDIELMQAGLQNKFETLFTDPYFNKNQGVKIGDQRLIAPQKNALKVFLDRYSSFCKKHNYPGEKFIISIHKAVENTMSKINHVALNFDEISSVLQKLPSEKMLAILNSFEVSWILFVQLTLKKYRTRLHKENSVKTVETSSIRKRSGGPVKCKQPFKKISTDSPGNPPTTFGELISSSCPPAYENAILNRGGCNTSLPNYNTSIFNLNHSGSTATPNYAMTKAADNSIDDISHQLHQPNNFARMQRKYPSPSIPQQQPTIPLKQRIPQRTALQSQPVPTTPFQPDPIMELQHQFSFPNAAMSHSMLPRLAFDQPPLFQQQNIPANYCQLQPNQLGSTPVPHGGMWNHQWRPSTVQEPGHAVNQYRPNYPFPLNPSPGNPLYPQVVPRYRMNDTSGYQLYGNPAAKYSILSNTGPGYMQNTQSRPFQLSSVNTANYSSNSYQKNYYPESIQTHPTIPGNGHLNRNICQRSSIPTPVIQSKININVHINNQSTWKTDSTMQTVNAPNIDHVPTIQGMAKFNGLNMDGIIDKITGSQEKLQEPAVTQSATENNEDNFPFPAFLNQRSRNQFQPYSGPQPLSVNQVNSSSASPTSGQNAVEDRNLSTSTNRPSPSQMPISVPHVQSSSKTPEMVKTNAAPLSANFQSPDQNHRLRGSKSSGREEGSRRSLRSESDAGQERRKCEIVRGSSERQREQQYENFVENKVKENSSISTKINEGGHFPECNQILQDFFNHVTQDESFHFHG